MMNTTTSDAGIGFGDIALFALVTVMLAFVIYQFRIGEASGKNGWINKSRYPTHFAILMSVWTFIVGFGLVMCAFDIYARINHLPR
jgi:hypothetical protein